MIVFAIRSSQREYSSLVLAFLLLLPVGLAVAPGTLSAPTMASEGPTLAAEGPLETPECVVDDVPGLGPACRLGDDLYEVFSAGGESLGTTHGPDSFPGPKDGEEPDSASGPRTPTCVGSSEPYYALLIYARAHDDTDRYSTAAPQLRSLAADANGVLNDAASQHGHARDLKVQCSSGTMVVKNEVLPTSKSSASFSSIVSDLRAAGYTSTKVKYWVYYDDGSLCSCSGTAHLYFDDRLVQDNKNNGNPYTKSMFAVLYGTMTVRAFLHETSHTMGAVQKESPHASGAGHCNDGRDVMCYNDGGPSSDYSSGVCSAQQYDCNSDDYFHPAPPSGSWLHSHWNVGSTLNRFLDTTRSGDPSPSPTPSTSPSPTPSPTPSSTPTAPPTPTTPPNAAPAMRSLGCDSLPKAGQPASCRFRATDAEGSAVTYTIDWGDGASGSEPSSGSVAEGVERSAAHTWSAPGTYTVKARATDSEGATSAWRAVTVVVQPGCQEAFTGALDVGLAGTSITGISASYHDVPQQCKGRPFALGTPDSLSDFNVCWMGYWGDTLGCHSNVGPDSGVIPAAATRARVEYHVGLGATYVLTLG